MLENKFLTNVLSASNSASLVTLNLSGNRLKAMCLSSIFKKAY